MPKRKPAPTRRRLRAVPPAVECDTRDEKSTNACTWEKTDSQRRFLTAYAERPYIASASRVAGVARCTVYRWMATIPAFEKAVREAFGRFAEEAKKRWLAEAEARRRWREERERARRPMRCYYLAIAREALNEALRRRGGRKRRPWTY